MLLPFWLSAAESRPLSSSVRREGGASVDPADGNPLRLREQSLHSLLQRVEGLVQVVVDNSQVEVVAVGPADPGALVHRLLQIVFLLRRRGRDLY